MKALLLLPVIALTALMPPFTGHISLTSEEQIKNQCLEMEDTGAIPPHSCSCSEKLFTSWHESYDWMDACGILQGRDSTK